MELLEIEGRLGWCQKVLDFWRFRPAAAFWGVGAFWSVLRSGASARHRGVCVSSPEVVVTGENGMSEGVRLV